MTGKLGQLKVVALHLLDTINPPFICGLGRSAAFHIVEMVSNVSDTLIS